MHAAPRSAPLLARRLLAALHHALMLFRGHLRHVAGHIAAFVALPTIGFRPRLRGCAGRRGLLRLIPRTGAEEQEEGGEAYRHSPQ